jgi:uncharacterized protein (TIGR02996 family)
MTQSNRIALPLLAEEAFVRAIQEEPDDDAPRRMYADWLEEHNDPRGEYLRLLARLEATDPKSPERRELRARLRELRKSIDPAWRATVARPPIERCPKFAFKCPKRWDRLTATDDPAVRYCKSCRRNVYYCATVAEARSRARRGHCVAVDLVPVRRPRDLSPPRCRPPRRLMGRMLPHRLRE